MESGEVPKRLKGLPWKGSRSLIAARGFKSLLLRSHSFVCAFSFLCKKGFFIRNMGVQSGLNKHCKEKSKKIKKVVDKMWKAW